MKRFMPMFLVLLGLLIFVGIPASAAPTKGGGSVFIAAAIPDEAAAAVLPSPAVRAAVPAAEKPLGVLEVLSLPGCIRAKAEGLVLMRTTETNSPYEDIWFTRPDIHRRV